MNLLAISFLIIIVFVLLCLFLYFIFTKKPEVILKNNYSDNYAFKKSLFSPAERSFFGVLKQSFSENFEIFGKVRIADVLKPKSGLDRSSWRISFSKISSKHFDYVLCDRETLQILAVIELDDKSHEQQKTVERNIFVEAACKSSGLPLIRFECKSSYPIEFVRKKIMNSVNIRN